MPHSESSVRSATRPSWGACCSSSRCSGSSTSPAQVASWIAFLGDSSCSFCSTCEVGRACLTSCGKPSKRGATPRPPRLQRPLASSSSKLTGAALPGSRWPACSSSGPRWRPELPPHGSHAAQQRPRLRSLAGREHDKDAISAWHVSSLRGHACPRVLHIAHALADTRAARDRSKDRVLVEVDDEEYKNYCLPGHEGVPPGHFFIRAISSENAWSFHTAGKEKISVVRKQVPLAPRCVLTHYGLQGVTARRGLVAFLSRPSWMKDADYALAMYVMLSRPRKLDDLWIIDLPERDVFEGHLHARNTTLVERMQQFEAQALRDESRALSYVRKQGWHSSEFVSDLFPSGAFERRVRQKLRA